MIKKILSTLFIVALIIGCVKVSSLSPEGQIELFKIVPNSITQGVELAAVSSSIGNGSSDKPIATPANTVNIYITKGQQISPIEFRASIGINKDAEKILNLTPYMEDGIQAKDKDGNPIFQFSFAEINNPVVFYVIAQSGHAEKWEAKLVFKPLKEGADITNLEIKKISDNIAITQNPSIQNANKKIDLYFNGSFPATIEPTITISDGAELSESYSSLTFESKDDIKTVTVTSESGSSIDWSIQLNKTEKATPLQLYTLPIEQKSRMAVNYQNIKPTIKIDTQIEELKLSIDSVNAKIVIYTTSKEKINLNTTPQAGSEILGNQSPILSRIPSKIFIMDATSGLYREWDITSSNGVPVIVMGASFASSAPSDQIVGKTPDINVTAKTITFYVNKDDFNVTLDGLICVTNSGTDSNLPTTARFTKEFPSISFNIIATGANELWSVRMKFKGALAEAELTDFEFVETKIDWSKMFIEPKAKKITVAVNQQSDLEFIPEFTISEGASITSESGNINNGVMSSIEINSVENLTITSQDGATKSLWTIEFIHAPQLQNRDFESVSVNDKSADYATHWASANVYNTLNVTLIGTTVESEVIADNADFGNAIKVITQEQDASILGKVIAAATIFKGVFDFSLALDYPRKLTKFGTPFTTNKMPLSFSIDAKYKAGKSMSQAIKRGFKYVIQPASGTDKAQVFMEMINYTDNGGDMTKVPNSYSGDGKNGVGDAAKGVNLLSRAELIIDGKTDTQYHNWQRGVESEFVNKNRNLPVTHIVFVTTSSMAGDKYLGAIGSEMWIDNVVMNYYKPEEGATIKNRR